jgi:hypothetical protein
LRLNLFGKTPEEGSGQLLGGCVDQSPTELRQLAADLRCHIVVQDWVASLFFQSDGRDALCKTGYASLSFSCDLVALRHTVADISRGFVEMDRVFRTMRSSKSRIGAISEPLAVRPIKGPML